MNGEKIGPQESQSDAVQKSVLSDPARVAKLYLYAMKELCGIQFDLKDISYGKAWSSICIRGRGSFVNGPEKAISNWLAGAYPDKAVQVTVESKKYYMNASTSHDSADAYYLLPHALFLTGARSDVEKIEADIQGILNKQFPNKPRLGRYIAQKIGLSSRVLES